ncbi:hypothetical protein ACFY0A_34885 [Streptomyces sp. NPDC001698]
MATPLASVFAPLFLNPRIHHDEHGARLHWTMALVPGTLALPPAVAT